MKKPYVLIPNADLIPEELQNIGKLTPLVYPINDRIVFDFLFGQYKDHCREFKIVCWKQADSIKTQLEDYSDRVIEVIKLDQIKDLAYTIYNGIEDDASSVIVNFSDTIVMENIYDFPADSFFYSEDFPNDKWTYFEEKNGVITEVYDKVSLDNFEEKKKLFVGIFYFSDGQLFKECLKTESQKTSEPVSTFFRAICLYSKRNPLKPVKTNKWFDIGHTDKYFNAYLEVKARSFNHITIDSNRGILNKTSDNKSKLIDEILWYIKLPKDIEYVRPRIFNYSSEYESPYISMEYYSYHTLHELFLYGNLSYDQWYGIFSKIKFICDDFKRYTLTDDRITFSLEDMYLNKTVSRLEKLKNTENFSSFFNSPFTVNGVTYMRLTDIVDIIRSKISSLYDVGTFNIIHGDLCFSNILIDNNFSFIKLIDPRGKFGTFDIYGDYRYDIAKLLHSIDGKYDFIIKDLFKIDYNAEAGNINFKVTDCRGQFNITDIFLSVFKDDIGNDIDKLYCIEALLFLSMIPLHMESLEHQYAMLATGIEILSRIANIKL